MMVVKTPFSGSMFAVFYKYGSSLRDFLRDCDIGGFGIKRFDLPILEAEFRRAGIDFSRQGRRILDAMVIYHKFEPRDLTAAYKKYCGKDLASNHASKADVRAAMEVLEAQLDMYSELPGDIAGIHEYCYPEESNWIDAEGKFIWSEGEAKLGFGRQYKGKSLKEIARIDPGYLRWIANGEFSVEVKEIAAKALKGEFPKPSVQQTGTQKHVDDE
jgi:DNA polymerase-3 subunit epsilon